MEQVFRPKIKCRSLVSAAILVLASLFLTPEFSAQNMPPETAKASQQSKTTPKIKPGSKDDVQAMATATSVARTGIHWKKRSLWAGSMRR